MIQWTIFKSNANRTKYNYKVIICLVILSLLIISCLLKHFKYNNLTFMKNSQDLNLSIYAVIGLLVSITIFLHISPYTFDVFTEFYCQIINIILFIVCIFILFKIRNHSFFYITLICFIIWNILYGIVVFYIQSTKQVDNIHFTMFFVYLFLIVPVCIM